MAGCYKPETWNLSIPPLAIPEHSSSALLIVHKDYYYKRIWHRGYACWNPHDQTIYDFLYYLFLITRSHAHNMEKGYISLAFHISQAIKKYTVSSLSRPTCCTAQCLVAKSHWMVRTASPHLRIPQGPTSTCNHTIAEGNIWIVEYLINTVPKSQ